MRRLSAALLGLLLFLGACTNTKPAVSAAPTASGAPLVYVAVGASESVGVGASDPLRGAWPQLFYRSALPRSTVFVNMAVSGSTVAQALVDQVPTAVGLAPNVVTVWLNVNDIIHGVTPASYEADLGRLVTALRRGGATKVLVADTPPLDDLPAYRACLAGQRQSGPTFTCPSPLPTPAALDATVDAYNAATARVVAASGAVLVDLHAAGLATRASGIEASLVGSDGFHPSDAGHTLVAKAFAAALG